MSGRRWPRTRIGIALVLIGLVSGCVGGRTVLVSEDSPLRIGPNVTGEVYTLIDGEWRRSDGPVQIPEGWYAIPPSFVHPEDFERG